MRPPTPRNEIKRIARLRALGLLDTPAEDVLDSFTRLAAAVTGMPIALLSLVDSDRQWFKAAVGMPQGAQTPRDISFCGHAIAQEGIFEVQDARTDPRFRDNPLVHGDPHVVHYAGVPLSLPDGLNIGTLCLIDSRPGQLSLQHREILTELASSLVRVLLLRERDLASDRDRLLTEAAQLSELAPIGMFSIDARGDAVHGNAQWVRMLGAAGVEACIGARWQQAVHPDDVAGVVAAWNQAVREKTATVLTFRTRGEGDAQRWLRFRIAPVDARLAPIAFVGASIDITPTVRLEQQLQGKNQLLEGIIENLPCGLAVFDADLRHIMSNAPLRAMLDLPAQLFGNGSLGFEDIARIAAERGEYGDGDPRAMLAQRVESVRRREPQHVERRLQNGHVVEVRGTFMPDGALINTYFDVTDARRAAAELRVARDQADQASRAKSEFLATMSHEIRTPLNGVIGLSQLLVGADLPPMEKDSVALIDSCAKSLLSLVDNILDFSKIEAGRLTLEQVPTDLAQLLREVGDVFTVRAAEKGIRFDLKLEAQVPTWISADPGRLRQILLNLLGNALKFTMHGGFFLHVSTRGEGAARQLVFEVRDTGIGIAPEDQGRLFSRFTQVDASSTRAHSGTGLGLAISRQLGQLMGGDVTLVSQPGLGSTFTLQIPLVQAEMPAGARRASAGEVHGNARILLVEDNEVNRLVARRMLGKLGYHDIAEALTGREAVDACARNEFDIVLMDCQMPEMDGWAATRQLRANGVTVPIVAFTASATSVDRDKCMRAGMDDYMAKPIELTVLAEKMQRWLEASSQRPAAAPARADGPAPPAGFDAAAIAQYFFGDTALFRDARALFLQQTQDSLAQLPPDRVADAEAVRRLMHRIRGSAATLGANRLAAIALRIEQDETAGEAQVLQALREAREAFAAFAAASERI